MRPPPGLVQGSRGLLLGKDTATSAAAFQGGRGASHWHRKGVGWPHQPPPPRLSLPWDSLQAVRLTPSFGGFRLRH